MFNLRHKTFTKNDLKISDQCGVNFHKQRQKTNWKNVTVSYKMLTFPKCEYTNRITYTGLVATEDL